MTKKQQKSSAVKLEQKLFIGIMLATAFLQSGIMFFSIFNSGTEVGVSSIIYIMTFIPLLYLIVSYPFVKHLSGYTEQLFQAFLIAIAALSVWGVIMTAIGYASQYMTIDYTQPQSDLLFYGPSIGATLILEVLVLVWLKKRRA